MTNLFLSLALISPGNCQLTISNADPTHSYMVQQSTKSPFIWMDYELLSGTNTLKIDAYYSQQFFRVKDLGPQIAR